MVLNQFGCLILASALLLSLSDIYGHLENENDVDEDSFKKEFDDEDGTPKNGESIEDEEIHIRKPSSHFTSSHTIKKLPEMKFLFCVSCGYRQAFDEFSRFIHEKYPAMKISGSNYSPTAWKSIIAQVIGFGKIALIVMIVMGTNPFSASGMETPRIVNWAFSNKLSCCMMLFLISNAVESSLMSTGAFEIFLGNEQIWSKLESGRVPSPSELLQIVDQHMELQGAKVSDTFTFA